MIGFIGNIKMKSHTPKVNKIWRSLVFQSQLQIILFVYDITNYSSFEDLEEWLDVVKSVFAWERGRKPHMGLIGNKGQCW